MRRTAPRSSLDCLSASEPSPSLRTATAAQPPPQIASRFPCLLRRRCPLSSARARRRGGPWDRWSGPRPPFRSRSRTALPGPVRRSSALTSPCTWCLKVIGAAPTQAGMASTSHFCFGCSSISSLPLRSTACSSLLHSSKC